MTGTIHVISMKILLNILELLLDQNFRVWKAYTSISTSFSSIKCLVVRQQT